MGSPLDVAVPAQATTLGPEKTSFFQALAIPTKITRGMIEITSNVPLLRTGVKVGPSEAALLNMLNIRPFEYGFDILNVYDSGSVFDPCILDITAEDLRKRFCAGVANVAAVSLNIGYPTSSSPRSSSSRRSWPIHLPLPQPHQLRRQLPRRPPPRPQPSRRRNLTMTWASTCSVKKTICSVYLFCSLFEQIKQAR